MDLRISRTVWSVLFACLCMVALGLSDNIRGPLFADLLSFFNVSNAAGSLSFAVASTANLFGTLLSTRMLNRIHLDRLLLLSMVFMGVGLLAMSQAPTYLLFIGGAIVFGFSMGTTGVAQNLLIAENIKQTYQPKVFSGLHGIYGLSSLMAPFIASRAPTWFRENFPQSGLLTEWRSAFFLTALLCLLLFISIAVTRAEPKFESAHHGLKTKPKIKDKRALIYISLFFAGYVAAEILVATRLALYMRTYFNMDLEHSSNYVTYFFIFLLAGRLFFTVKSLNFPLRRQLSASLFLSMVTIVLGLTVHPLFLAATGLFMAPFYPMSVAYISELTGPMNRTYFTTALAIQSIFVVGMHVGVGYLTDVFGLFYAYGVSLALLLMALICVNVHPPVPVE
jgi:MFS transporter, FHS family, glucose/mannose:H+ symporter